MRSLFPFGTGLAALLLLVAPARAAEAADCPDLAAVEAPCAPVPPPCSPAPCAD